MVKSLPPRSRFEARPPGSPHPLSVDEARRLLRDSPLRRTPCRIAVLQHLSAADRPLNHAEVCAELVPLGFEKSTIYRCLVEMTQAELLRRFELGDHVWRFALNQGAHKGRSTHPHFVCVRCGQVVCLSQAEVRITLDREEPSLELSELIDIILRGYCEQCRE